MADRDNHFACGQSQIEYRVLHLDLKGSPPTPDRLITLLDVIKAAHYNALLVEWENMFPWTIDKRFRSSEAYSPETIRKFNDRAVALGLEVIPLVQCLGHLENVLVHDEYKHLREVPYSCDTLNPLAKGSRELIEGMVKDVLALSPPLKFFHLGGDEAWTFGTHPDTRQFIQNNSEYALYMRHVGSLLDQLNQSGIRPLLWNDMMVNWSSAHLSDLAKAVDVVVWGYAGHPDTASYKHYHRGVIERFVQNKVPLWGATAYKGADGFDASLPDLTARQANALAWTEIAHRYKFRGLIATGWSRYGTHALQCEPIESALDSMFTVGSILSNGLVPQDGPQTCRAELEALGELSRFTRCRDSLSEFHSAYISAWNHARKIRQRSTLSKIYPEWCKSHVEVRLLQGMEEGLERARELGFKAKYELDGLIAPKSLDSYFRDRMESLVEEFDSLETLVYQRPEE